ncbi:MAG: histidine kinase, partial [Bosea sp. (in: a-proteobacteria)]
MADFYPVLARAVAALPVNTAEARRSIYERARGALVGQLRTIQPALSEVQISAQAAALDDAAQRIEAEYAAPPPVLPEPEPIKVELPKVEAPKVEAPSFEPAKQEPAKQEPAKQEIVPVFAPIEPKPVFEAEQVPEP